MTISAVADSMAQLLRQVDALSASVTVTAHHAAAATLASNSHVMSLALDDSAAMRALSYDLAAVLATDVNGNAYLRAAAELACLEERRVDMQVREACSCAAPAAISLPPRWCPAPVSCLHAFRTTAAAACHSPCPGVL